MNYWKNLDYLVNISCNILLFASGLAETQIKSINKRNDHFIWYNYYDRDDFLSWPLKQLSASYYAQVTDYEINTGLYVGHHEKYWDDNDFTKPLAQKLNELYETLQFEKGNYFKVRDLQSVTLFCFCVYST